MGARLGERTASSGSSVELVCAGLARRWPWLSVRLWLDPPMPPSPPRLPATTSIATAPISAVMEHTQTSARRPAANVEENLLHQEDEDKDENNTGMLKRRLQILFEFSPVKNYEIYNCASQK